MKILKEDMEKIEEIYRNYDAGNTDDKYAFFEIKDILREKYNCVELDKAVQEGLDLHNEGASGMLLELLDFVEKFK